MAQYFQGNNCAINYEIYDSDYVAHSTDITKKSANTYQVKKDLYYGYWGSNQGQSNYEIIYQVKKNSKSAYGYIITNMKITAI